MNGRVLRSGRNATGTNNTNIQLGDEVDEVNTLSTETRCRRSSLAGVTSTGQRQAIVKRLQEHLLAASGQCGALTPGSRRQSRVERSRTKSRELRRGRQATGASQTCVKGMSSQSAVHGKANMGPHTCRELSRSRKEQTSARKGIHSQRSAPLPSSSSSSGVQGKLRMSAAGNLPQETEWFYRVCFKVDQDSTQSNERVCNQLKQHRN